MQILQSIDDKSSSGKLRERKTRDALFKKTARTIVKMVEELVGMMNIEDCVFRLFSIAFIDNNQSVFFSILCIMKTNELNTT